MPLAPGRGHSALRLGRHSVVGGQYFITCCTSERRTGLELAAVTAHILAVADAMSDDGTWILRTAVIMPNHVHLLVILGDREPLSGTIRLFKGRTSPILRNTDLAWQRGYFDHRMRDSEDLLPVFLYIFLNPHRAGLLKADEKWTGYYCAKEDWEWFSSLTDADCAFPEWIL